MGPQKGKQRAFAKQWDRVIMDFLDNAGLVEARRGFETDILVMNSEFEKQRLPAAIGNLMKDLMQLGQVKPGQPERELEARKLDYVAAQKYDSESRSSVNHSISTFLAQNRARSDQSNREEFLKQLHPSKRRKLSDAPEGVSDPSEDALQASPTCARTDMVQLNRDIQMKYDVAQNDEGPLSRTIRGKVAEKDPRNDVGQGNGGLRRLNGCDELELTKTIMDRHPGLEERFNSVENHLSVRYIPSPPEDLLMRVKMLEDHLIRLEKDYPPWAALHFNQPRRGWPPPPRATPIIVPSHLATVLTTPIAVPSLSATIAATLPQAVQPGLPKPKAKPRAQSSLHRAVMEKLEVQRALGDLGKDTSPG
ncbi:hypothetical protein BOTBODRAFT_212672 [Botryobasidium botryosum FD-172 SS1]|uniref:Uncharacterized protein n=1 Tax=Botryobasidium botryosum (strain FD-172 SS1) TaxID=930990 RepID=A0A067NCB5_BOTB1|nr:hypothetical protein BOTBODRAFT_212672 [Botryobasidium botryosum FD-172 SS1]